MLFQSLKNKYYQKKINKNSIFNESLWFKFLKIFIVYFFSMFTIVVHNLVPLLIGYLNNHNVSGALVSQSIGYTQPIIFFAITIIIMISIQILTITKNNLNDDDESKNIFKNITNTGLITMVLSITGIAIIFIATMFLYSNITIGNLSIIEKGIISKFIKEYSSMMILNLLLIGISVYYIFCLTEFKFKISWLFFTELFLSFISILLSVIFILYTNISPAICLALASFIPNIIKLITIMFIFYKYIAYWKVWEMSFDKKIFFEIWNMISALSFYMFVYSMTMVFQMILINSLSNVGNKYLYTENGEYLIVLSRVLVYSLINLMITLSRSMGRALNLHFDRPILDLKKSEKQFSISMKYSIIITIIFSLLGILFAFLMPFFVDGLFARQGWSFGVIPIVDQSSIPFPHIETIKYIDVIKKFAFEGFLISLGSQILLGLSINIRIGIFFNFKRDLKIFWVILFTFFVTISLGNYFLGVELQDELPGLIGFSIAQMINSFFALIIVLIGFVYTKHILINEILTSINEEKLKPIYKYKSLKKYSNDRAKKRLICLNAN